MTDDPRPPESQPTTPPSPADEDDREMVGHLLKRGVPLLALVLLIGGGFFYWKHRDDTPKHVAAAAPAGPVPVDVVTVKQETVPIHPRFLGQTEGSQVVEIRARVAGYLLERTFKEGEHVTKGQQLFKIDPRPFEVELAQAKARLASSEATRVRAEQQVKRFEELLKTNAAPQAQLEEWQTQENVAAADVELQKAMIASAELQLGYTSIESPVNGVIGQALKEVGSYVDAGSNGLVAVVQQVDPMYVRYSVTEQDMLRWQRQMAEGKVSAPKFEDMELQIILSDGSVYPLTGRINFVDIEVAQTTGTSVIRGQVPNPKNVLKPGQFIYAEPLGISRVDVVRVPQRAVLQSPAGASVYVLNDKDTAEMRPITLGDWSDDQWIVEKGLRPGDRVVTSRLIMVRPGVHVTPTEVAASPTTAPAATAPAASADERK